MAVGEAGCASVHGANRLGSNSLIDLVVFGRAAAIRAGQVIDRNAAIPALNEASVEKIMDRFDRLRHANGGTPTAELREKMQRAMQEDAAVFRTQETLENGCKRMSRDLERAQGHQGHRPLDDLELRPGRDAGAGKPDGQRHHHGLRRRGAQGEPRRACARGFLQRATTSNWRKHTLALGRRRRQGDARATGRCTPSRCWPRRTAASASRRSRPRRGCIESWRRAASGYSGTPLPAKLGLKDGMRAAFIALPDGTRATCRRRRLRRGRPARRLVGDFAATRRATMPSMPSPGSAPRSRIISATVEARSSATA